MKVALHRMSCPVVERTCCHAVQQSVVKILRKKLGNVDVVHPQSFLTKIFDGGPGTVLQKQQAATLVWIQRIILLQTNFLLMTYKQSAKLAVLGIRITRQFSFRMKVSFRPCQQNLLEAFQNEADTLLITKITIKTFLNIFHRSYQTCENYYIFGDVILEIFFLKNEELSEQFLQKLGSLIDILQ